MTKKLKDSELDKIDGGLEDFQENPVEGVPFRGSPPPAPPQGEPGGGTYPDLQQNPPDGGPDADA